MTGLVVRIDRLHIAPAQVRVERAGILPRLPEPEGQGKRQPRLRHQTVNCCLQRLPEAGWRARLFNPPPDLLLKTRRQRGVHPPFFQALVKCLFVGSRIRFHIVPKIRVSSPDQPEALSNDNTPARPKTPKNIAVLLRTRKAKEMTKNDRGFRGGHSVSILERRITLSPNQKRNNMKTNILSSLIGT